MTLSEAFAQLGLPPDSDGRAVRRAYAQLLKGLDQVSQPQAFMELRAAYELAMAHVRANANVQEPGAQAQLNEPQADAFVRDSLAFIARPAPGPERPEHAEPTKQMELAETPEPPEPPEPPEDVANRVLDGWQCRFQPWELDAATQELRILLKRPELQGFDNREAFERRLARRIAGRTFGARSSALLLAADTVFDWRRRGVGVEPLEHILDSLARLPPMLHKVATGLLGEPNPDSARELLLTPRFLGYVEQQWQSWLKWWLPEEQLHHWGLAWHRIPIGTRASMGLVAGAKLAGLALKVLGARLAIAGLIVVAAIFVFRTIADRTSGKQVAQEKQACVNAYADRRLNGWHDVPSNKLYSLRSCRSQGVHTIPDQRGMDQAERIARVLVDPSTGWIDSSPLWGDYLRLNTKDGRAFGFERVGSVPSYCANIRAFALKGLWLKLGDVPAATGLVREVAWCQAQLLAAKNEGRDNARDRVTYGERHESDALWAFLRHTDAWPDGARPALPLESLVRGNTAAGFDWRLPTEGVPQATQHVRQTSRQAF